MGVRLAIDDTGAGFASLSHVLSLRPDIVKLDIDLIRGIHIDPALAVTGLRAADFRRKGRSEHSSWPRASRPRTNC